MKRRRLPPPLSAGSPSPLLTTAEVAALLRVHGKQVYRLFARGLPRQRVGGEWRYDREQVLRWCSGSTAPADGAPRPVPAPLLACNGDVAVEILLRRVGSTSGALVGSVPADRGSALDLLRSGAVLGAGYHGDVFPSRLPEGRLARLHLVRRGVGLVGPRDRPPRTEDLATARVASRPLSAGIRQTLDRALAGAGLDSATVHARAQICATHAAVVSAVASGAADVGVATHALAHRLGLSFTELAVEDYGLLFLAAHLGRPEVLRLLEAAQEHTLRRLLSAEAGYDAHDTGTLRLDPDPPSGAAA